MPSVLKGISLSTQDEFSGVSTWIANCLLMLVPCVTIDRIISDYLQADTVLGAFSEFLMFDAGWLFITQLICLALPLLYIVIMRPFRDWLKNMASISVYCISILAIVAPICPPEAQFALGYVAVILMFLVSVALIAIPIARRLKKRIAVAKSQRYFFHMYLLYVYIFQKVIGHSIQNTAPRTINATASILEQTITG